MANDTVGALLEGRFYTLRQATQVLGIDTKTLQKRMQRAHIEPSSSSDDRRLRLLSEEQLDRLRSPLERMAKIPRSQTPLGETMKMLKLLTRRIAKLEDRLSKQEEEKDHLQRELAWRMEEWERTSAALLGVLAVLQGEAIDRGDTNNGDDNTPAPASAGEVQETATRLIRDALASHSSNK